MKLPVFLFVLPLFSVAAFAQSSDLRALSQAQADARAALAAARGGRVALSCRDAAGHPYDSVAGTLNLKTSELALASTDVRPALDASKGAALVDERCGEVSGDFSASLSYDVTGPHEWGQDILQLPKAALPRAGSAVFLANLHTCAYDGEWYASDNVAVTCTATVK